MMLLIPVIFSPMDSWMLDPLVLRVFYCDEEKELEFRRVYAYFLA